MFYLLIQKQPWSGQPSKPSKSTSATLNPLLRAKFFSDILYFKWSWPRALRKKRLKATSLYLKSSFRATKSPYIHFCFDLYNQKITCTKQQKYRKIIGFIKSSELLNLGYGCWFEVFPKLFCQLQRTCLSPIRVFQKVFF